MNLGTMIDLQEAWQRAVRDHAAFLRDAQASKMSASEIHRRGRVYLDRIDTTFSKLKAAELDSRELPKNQISQPSAVAI